MTHKKLIIHKLYFFCFALLISLHCMAQQEETGRYDMPYHINSVALSSDSSYLCLTFMQTGRSARYGVFDLESRQLAWLSETMDTERGKVVPTKFGLLVMRDWGLLWNISLIDAQRGTATWTEPGVGGFRYDEQSDMALAVKKNAREPGLILKAFNVSNGDTLWRYRINHEFVQGMNGGMYSVCDTIALVVADQLCLVSRGSGNIGYCGYDAPQPGADMPTLVRGNRIYVSDKGHLTCYDNWLTRQWSASHPATAHARLLRIGKRLCLINEGYIRKVLPPDHTGVSPIVNEQTCKPFIAQYDAETGSRLMLKTIDWKSSNGTMERIFVNAVFYVKNDDTESFSKVTPPTDGCFVKVSDGRIYVLDEKMKIRQRYESDQIYHRQFVAPNRAAIICNGDAYVITPDGRPITHLPQGTTSVFRIGKELFYSIGDTLCCAPLK